MKYMCYTIEAARVINELGGKNMSFNSYKYIVKNIIELDELAKVYLLHSVGLYEAYLILPIEEIKAFDVVAWKAKLQGIKS
jgi:hypothetical protein